MLQATGQVFYYPPGSLGYASKFGHGHDWYPTKDWSCWDMEWIEPLRALGPRPDLRPQATTLSQFELLDGYHNLVRDVTLSGNPAVSGIQYYDGKVYPAGSSLEDTMAALATVDDRPPSWVLHTVRNAPPPGQGISTFIGVSMVATHSTDGVGRLGLFIPLGSEKYPQPLLHWIAPVPDHAYDISTEGSIVTQFAAGSAAKQGGNREVFVCQVEQLWRTAEGLQLWSHDPGDGVYLGAWVLLRCGDNLEQWTSWWTPDLQFADSPLVVSVGGAVQSFTLTPIEYGGPDQHPWTAHCEPPDSYPVPTAAHGTWNESPTVWAFLPSRCDDWTVSAEEADSGRKPSVTMERDVFTARHTRPLLWRASVRCPAEITIAPHTGYPVDTASSDTLMALSVTLNNEWKGASGTATFRPSWPAPCTGWGENGIVQVAMGLTGETGLWAQRSVLVGRIKPDGVQYSRDGATQGKPALTLSFGDLAASALQNKVLLDWPSQAGIRLVCTAADPCSTWGTGYCWLHSIANRMGLDYGQVAYDTSGITECIPLNPLPSVPTLVTPDGTGFLEHIRAVEAACGVRVRFDYAADGKLSMDRGIPAYTHGVSPITYVLDETHMDKVQFVRSISSDRGGAQWRNAAKFRITTSQGEVVFYWIDEESERLATVVDDWWAYYSDDDAESMASLWQRFQREGHRWKAAIRWTQPLCPGLRPDMFVQLNVTSVGAGYGSVYQITEHTMEANVDAGTALSTLTASIVYPDMGGAY